MNGNGLFPQQNDGGVAPNPEDLNNPTQAFAPTTSLSQPIDTSALYYGNGCDIQVRPHVMNSILSEIFATVDRAQIAYQVTSLQNLETAVRYLIQRGLPRAGWLVEDKVDQANFTLTLDPPATHYSDFMTLTLVPHILREQVTSGILTSNIPGQNMGEAFININDLGYIPLLRNDGTKIQAGDFKHGRPFFAVCVDCVFYRTP